MTPYGLLTPYKKFQKKLISQFQENCQKEGQMRERTYPNSKDPFGHSCGQKYFYKIECYRSVGQLLLDQKFGSYFKLVKKDFARKMVKKMKLSMCCRLSINLQNIKLQNIATFAEIFMKFSCRQRILFSLAICGKKLLGLTSYHKQEQKPQSDAVIKHIRQTKKKRKEKEITQQVQQSTFPNNNYKRDLG